MEAGFVESRAGAAVARLPSTPLIFASRNRTAAIWMCRGRRRLLVSVAGGKSSLTVAATNIGDGTKAHTPFDVRLANVRLNGRLLHSMRQWKRPSPAPGAALRKFFCGWQGRRAARRPSSRRPSRFPRPRVPLRGARINPCGPSGGQQALHQCQTQGDAHEATRSGIARCWPAEEPGPGAPPPRFRNSGRRASIRRPKPPGPNNGTPEHPQTL